MRESEREEKEGKEGKECAVESLICGAAVDVQRKNPEEVQCITHNGTEI